MEAQCLFGLVEHTLAVAPYNKKQLQKLDQIRAKCISKITKIGTCASSYIYLPTTSFGMGKESFLERAASTAAFHLFNIMNNQGKLGTMARASHYKNRDQLTPNQTPDNKGSPHSRFHKSLIVRLHRAAQAHNLIPMYDTNHQLVPLNELWETITAFNTLHNLQYPTDFLLHQIATPLWKTGIYSLKQLTNNDGTRILTAQEFTAPHPPLRSHTDTQTALKLLALLLCRKTTYNPNTTSTNATDPLIRTLPSELRAPENRKTTPIKKTILNKSIETETHIPPYPQPTQPTTFFSPAECNPDHDIPPPHRNTIIIQPDMAWTYNAHGQCMAAVQSQTLTHLLHHYNKPLTDTQTTTDDLCKLIWTHAGPFEDPTHQEQKQNTFDLPTALFNALTEITTATTNWYTNGIRTAPSPLRYNSQHEIDTNFGDRAPIFTCKWRGAGVAQLPNNPETIAKAIKWAILSTYPSATDPSTDMPSCTTLLFQEQPQQHYNYNYNYKVV